MIWYAGLDIGGTKCAVTLGAPQAETIDILAKRSFPTPSRWEDALEAMFQAVESLSQEHGLSMDQLSGVGVSCGNPLDAQKGLILSPPNLPGWDNVPITQMAKARLGAPAHLENDANACALAEWRWGAGRGSEHMVFLTFGTGMGAGLILNGRLYRGRNGNSGEVGHWRLNEFGPVGYGKLGSFEGFCSGGGLRQLGLDLALQAVQLGKSPLYIADGMDQVSAKTIAEAARKGDETALKVFEICGRQLGRGLSMIVDIINPERIVIGSIFARCQDLLIPSMRAEMAKECLADSLQDMQILPAGLGEQIGDYAALSLAVGE